MYQHRKFGRAIIACIGVIGILGLLPGLARSAGVQVTPATRISTKDQVLGPLSLSQTIHVVISLKLRNHSKLKTFLSNRHHKFLSRAQFKQTYSPTDAQTAVVVNFLRQARFTNITVAPNTLLVSADAPASTVQTAFNTQLVSVQTHDGRNAYANSTPAEIPQSLQSTVQAVMGLQTVHVLHSHAQLVSTSASNLQTFSTPRGGYKPTQFPTIYGVSVAPVASKVTVAIMAEGSMTNVLTDLASFTAANSLPTVNTQVINTGKTSTDTSGDAEWDLDSQAIVGMAGGQVGKLIFYAAPSMSTSAFTTAFNKVVSDNIAKIINVSLGLCESNWGRSTIATIDAIFAQGAAQGQTFSVASGDAGADECSDGSTTPSYPASSPYVVAVGGTTLSTSGSTTWSGETVWSGTGGSPSTMESIPSWQVGVGQNKGSAYRGVPDIAFDADPRTGMSVIVGGAPAQIGGTSLSAPLFAGAWARVIQAKGTSVGFAAPLLYEMASNAGSTTFHDVTSGNNISPGDITGESAAIGWDYCTGWGSMVIDQALVPTTIDGTVSTNENTQVSGTLSASDWDGEPLTIFVVDQPTNGNVTVTDPTTGAFTYMPNLNYYGTDTFTFKAKDISGMVSELGTETININGAPVATPGSVTTTTNTSVSGILSGSDPNGDKLTFSVATPTPNTKSGGTVNITNSATGAFTYTPPNNFTGNDSFTFTVIDSAGQSSTATESITINNINNAPVANAGSVTTNTNTSVMGTLSASDPDNDTLTFSVTTPPTHGSVSITNSATGAFTYTPATNYMGTDSFKFTAKDSAGQSSTATESITIINSPPVANAGSVTTTVNTSVLGTLSASDPDNDTLTFSVTSNLTSKGGTVNITNSATGAFTYTPPNNLTGSDSFTFTVKDSANQTSTATESITINNIAPVATTGSVTTSANTSVMGTLNGSDPDGDTLTFSVASNPSNGTVKITDTKTGKFTYTPKPNFTGNDSFTFTVTDSAMQSSTATESVTIQPSSGGGGPSSAGGGSSSGGSGATGPWSLLGLMLFVWLGRRRTRSA